VHFARVALGNVAEVAAGNPAPQGDANFLNGTEPFIRTSDVGRVHLSSNFIGTADRLTKEAARAHRMRMFPKGTILFPKSGASTFLNHRVVMGEQAYVSSHLACIICNEEKLLSQFAYRLLCNVDARTITPDQAYPSLRTSEIATIEIPLPPVEVQRQIVSEIEAYQKVIDGARAVLENYRPHIAIDPEWPMKPFQAAASTITPPAKIQTAGFNQQGRFPIIDQSQKQIAGWTDDEAALVDGRGGLVIFGDHTCAVKFVNERFAQGADGIKIIKASASLLPAFLFFFLLSHPIEQDGYKRHFNKLKLTEIPVPPLETQREIVAELEAERGLVEANRTLIGRMEKKIEAAIARVWSAADADLAEPAIAAE